MKTSFSRKTQKIMDYMDKFLNLSFFTLFTIGFYCLLFPLDTISVINALGISNESKDALAKIETVQMITLISTGFLLIIKAVCSFNSGQTWGIGASWLLLGILVIKLHTFALLTGIIFSISLILLNIIPKRLFGLIKPPIAANGS